MSTRDPNEGLIVNAMLALSILFGGLTKDM